MLKRILHIFITASLVFLMMLSGVAHEFVHSFTGHEDTVHATDSKQRPGVMSFEKEHHHCDFLHFPAPVFVTSSFHFTLHPFLFHKDRYRTQQAVSYTAPAMYTSLRGPPACG